MMALHTAVTSPLGAPSTILRAGDAPPLRAYYAALQAIWDREASRRAVVVLADDRRAA